jgi:hypothetical protein
MLMYGTLYRDGDVAALGPALWATSHREHAARFARRHAADLWALTLELRDDEILDLTLSRNPEAVARALAAAGIPADYRRGEDRHPQSVVRRLHPDAVLHAGYRAVLLCEAIEGGPELVTSLLLVDLSAVVSRQIVPMDDHEPARARTVA